VRQRNGPCCGGTYVVWSMGCLGCWVQEEGACTAPGPGVHMGVLCYTLEPFRTGAGGPYHACVPLGVYTACSN
jgi:hypothetical protein